MTNAELVNNLNALGDFVETQKNRNKSLLKPEAQFTVFKNRHSMINAYNPYKDTLDALKEQYDDTEIQSHLPELLNAEADVDISKIKLSDFTEEAWANDMILLEFMIEE